mmetsp:Transcript_18008/g.38868  ORF Transcript_18008/g.38868 Transcript_18008/m.38868 type:complete len:91 (+) Transcript_18008:2019-2291(+)
MVSTAQRVLISLDSRKATYHLGDIIEPWSETCFVIPSGEHEVEFSLCDPAFPLPAEALAAKPTKGVVQIDNIRVYPFPSDDFESGDFSAL